MTRRVAAILVAVLVALTTGCELSQDDEMAPPPKRTVTKSPAPPVPTQVPTGQGSVSPQTVVWAQDSTLHFGKRQVDVSPLRIDSFVVVNGGVFFISRSELWFTDLSRVRGTGFTGVTRVSTTRDAGALRVQTSQGSASGYAFDLATGASKAVDEAVPATDADLRGTPEQVVLRVGGSDAAPVDARLGPGGYGIVGGDGGQLVVFDATTHKQVPLKGVVAAGFKLVRWQGRTAFFGLALGDDGNPVAVMSCYLTTRSCTTFGKVVQGHSLVFESAA